MDCESQKQPPTKMLRPRTVLYSERQSNFIPSMCILHIKGLDSIKSHKIAGREDTIIHPTLDQLHL